MDIHLYFAIALGSLLILWGFLYYSHQWFLPRARFALTYFIQIQIPFINRTVPEIGAILIYLGSNAAALRFEGLSSSQLFSVLNLVLLFLGGRTNLIADSLGVSLREFYLAHQWVGITVTGLSIVHIIRAARSEAFDRHQLISGVVVASLLCLCLVLSFHSVVNSLAQVCKFHYPYTLFQKLHRLLSLFALIFLGWHLWTVSTPFSFSWITLFGTGSLWMASVALRMLRWYSYRAATLTIQSTEEAERLNITRLSIDTGSTVPALPGLYFYINIPGQHSSVCVPVAWWTDEENGSVRHVEVLIGRNIGSFPKEFRLRLGGPYGGDLSMGSFETVVLAAEGIGISGVLPFALSLISRWKHDVENRQREYVPIHRDMTRNIDLIWKLDRNCQYDCAAGYFGSLAETLKSVAFDEKDPRVRLLSVYIAYPESPNREKNIGVPVLPKLKNWHVTPDLQTLQDRVNKVANGKPGRTLVTACGTRRFMDDARALALQHSSKENIIWFRELSYRPETLKDPSYSIC